MVESEARGGSDPMGLRGGRYGFWLNLILPSVLVSACSPGAPVTEGSPNETVRPSLRVNASRSDRVGSALPGDWEKRRWIDKAARALRGRRGITPDENIEGLLKLSRDEIIHTFMADPRFIDSVLDFSIYFMGKKLDDLRLDPGARLNGFVHFFPQALTAAKEVQKGGDYFKIFDLNHPIWVSRIYRPEQLEPGDERLSDSELRKKNFQALLGMHDRVIATLEGNPGFGKEEVCKEVLKVSGLFAKLGAGSIISPVVIDSRYWLGPFVEACYLTAVPLPTGILTTLRKSKEYTPRLAEFLDTLDRDHYDPKKVEDFRAVDLPFPYEPALFYSRIAGSYLINNSTNFNRKRAAYVLNRFFCDDLTPVQVAAPTDHSQGRHGTEPTCFSCHYKLDPLAGFFRTYGTYFNDYAGRSQITFSDGVIADREAYEKNWLAAPGSNRIWDIGYVRSALHPELNEYGVELSDLHDILKKAPEVRQCLVRRMFEFFVGDSQAVEAGFLDDLTAKFQEESKVSSATAFKNTVARIVASQSFAEPFPVSSQCYDYGPGFDPKTSPPCRVAYLFQKNCASCHNSADPRGGLDLTRWAQRPDGSSNFDHLDASGKPRRTSVTFAALMDRLNTSDLVRRMPLGREMADRDRAELFRWAESVFQDAQARESKSPGNGSQP